MPARRFSFPADFKFQVFNPHRKCRALRMLSWLRLRSWGASGEPRKYEKTKRWKLPPPCCLRFISCILKSFAAGAHARLLGASVTQTAAVGVRRMPNEEPPLWLGRQSGKSINILRGHQTQSYAYMPAHIRRRMPRDARGQMSTLAHSQSAAAGFFFFLFPQAHQCTLVRKAGIFSANLSKDNPIYFSTIPYSHDVTELF